MSKYLKLIEATTPYGIRMTRLRNRIFGDVIRKTDKKSMKTVQLFSEKPIYLREEVVNYYPRHKETHSLLLRLRRFGLYRDEHQDFVDEMKRLRFLRGKVAPKKGEGKQAQRR